jgi:hypothetical protein
VKRNKNVILKTHIRGNKPPVSDSGGFCLLAPLGTASVFQSPIEPESSQKKRSNQPALIKAFVSQICLFGGGEPREILLPADTNLWTEFPDRWEESQERLEPVSNSNAPTLAKSGLLLVSGISK